MAILNNIEYLSMPQQVEKNKDDIAQLKIDTTNLLSLTQQVEKNKDDIAQLKIDTTKLIYGDTDTIPTPSVGGVATYIIVQVSSSDDGMLGLNIGGTSVFESTLNNKGGVVITISNIAGVFYVSNSNGYNTTVPNLIVTSDYLALMKLY